MKVIPMTHVVTTLCIGCKDKSCIAVCPVEAFHEGPEMLYINPETCVDCEGCVSECPIDAIYYEEDLPKAHRSAIELNAEAANTHPLATE